MIDLTNKTSRELKKLQDQIKVSDLSYEEKTKYLERIEIKLNGANYKNKMLLKQIEEAQADIEDIN